MVITVIFIFKKLGPVDSIVQIVVFQYTFSVFSLYYKQILSVCLQYSRAQIIFENWEEGGDGLKIFKALTHHKTKTMTA